jgi:CyaY protein
MTETEFLARAEETLDAIEARIEAAAERDDADLETARSGNVLHIETAGGAKLVVNLQTPMREIWVAARAGGFHYRWDGTAWRDTRDGSELFAALSRLVSEAGGAPLVL